MEPGVTERKPPGVRPEDWIERQIREARERGAFDNLEGEGKPLKGLDRPFSAEQWARDWIEREGGDLSALLPPLVQMRRERAAILAGLADVPAEATVREVVAEFNERLLDLYRRPIQGPMVAVGILDADATVEAWRQARPAPPVDLRPPAPGSARGRRRWWRGFRTPR